MIINSIFYIYARIGFLMIVFYKKISEIFYNLSLYFTGKMRLKNLFLFKIDKRNRDVLLFWMETFTISFGLFILLSSLYKIYF